MPTIQPCYFVPSVIPGRALARARNPLACKLAVKWILRCAIAHHSSCFARPGMTAKLFDDGQITCELLVSCATTIWMRSVRQNNPTGKSLRMFRNLSSPEIKNISLYPKPKSGLYSLPSRPDKRGVS